MTHLLIPLKQGFLKNLIKTMRMGGERGEGGGVYHHPISNKLCLFVKLRNFISHTIHFLVNKILKKIVFPLCKVYFSGDLHLKEELTFLSKLNETEMVLKVFLGFSWRKSNNIQKSHWYLKLCTCIQSHQFQSKFLMGYSAFEKSFIQGNKPRITKTF